MKITISVSGRSGDGDSTVQCGASFDVQNIDQDAMQQMTHAAKQCAATIASVTTSPSGQAVTNSTSYQPQNQSGKRQSTEKQVKAIRAMAGRQGIDLSPILHDRFGVSSPTALSISEASTLIDELKNNLISA